MEAKTKKTSLIVTILVILTAICSARYSGGTGEYDAPYLISTPEDLIALGDEPNDWDSSFELTNDINMAGCIFTKAIIAPDINDANEGFDGIQFTGKFHGNGHKILSLTIIGNDYLGLFGKTRYGSQVYDLGLEDVNIVGKNYLGGLIAYNQCRGLQNCCMTGSINGESYLGGLFGYSGSTVGQCYAESTINGQNYIGGLVGYNAHYISSCYAKSTVDGNDYTGGICGYNQSSIYNCYALGIVDGNDYVGGLCGSNSGYTGYSYSTALVTGNEYIGGLLGGHTGRIYNCYFLETAGPDNGIGTPLSLVEMMRPQSYVNWSFKHTWGICQGKDFPHLQWESYECTKYCGGIGEPNDPYLICSSVSLNSIGEHPEDWDKHFLMTNDINMSGYYYDKALIAYESSEKYFEGVFDGNNHTVSPLDINGIGCLGLFGRLGRDSNVINIEIRDVNIIGTGSSIGGLCGSVWEGGISNCHISGSVKGDKGVGGLCGEIGNGSLKKCSTVCDVNGNGTIGGLCGENWRGTIIDCNSTGLVYSEDYSDGIGGLIGSSQEGIIGNCNASGSVVGYSNIGGLIGHSWREAITNCNASGSVTGDDSSENIGGLVGHSDRGSISDCNAFGPISGSYSIGGLCGLSKGDIANSHAFGSVSGSYDVGGLCGFSSGDITNSHAFGSVIGERTLGGLCGYNEGNLTNCSASGSVIGERTLGGLCGNNRGNLTDCSASGSVTGEETLGGLCGRNEGGSIVNCWAAGSVTGRDYSLLLGGLCGSHECGEITESHATGSITSGNNSRDIGGLCGENFEGIISTSYATGSITAGHNSSYIGGLCGYNYSRTDTTGTENCYANSYIWAGRDSKYVGGLLGENLDGKIIHSYSASMVVGLCGMQFTGGLCGDSENGEFVNCYFRCGIDNGLGHRLSETQMKQKASFVNWDFYDTWYIYEGISYPKLQGEPVQAKMWCIPRVINTNSRRRQIITMLSMPAGIRKTDIDKSIPLMMYPGDITSRRTIVFEISKGGKYSTYVLGMFDIRTCINELGPGTHEIEIEGKLTNGQWFVGTCRLQIMSNTTQSLRRTRHSQRR